MNMKKKDVMLDFMSGGQTWKRRIRLRTQATSMHCRCIINVYIEDMEYERVLYKTWLVIMYICIVNC